MPSTRYRFTFPCPGSDKIDSFLSVDDRLYHGQSLDGKHFRVTTVHVRRAGPGLRVCFWYATALGKHSRWMRGGSSVRLKHGAYQRVHRGVRLARSARGPDAHRLVRSLDLEVRGIHDVREGDAVLDSAGEVWVPLDTKRAGRVIEARQAKGRMDPRRFVRFLYQHASREFCNVSVCDVPEHVMDD